jgi:hypothetical protein
MEIGKQIEQAQNQANQLAIQEANLREYIGALQAQLDQVVRSKHQAIGAVEAFKTIAKNQAPPAAPPQTPDRPPTPAERKAAKGK